MVTVGLRYLNVGSRSPVYLRELAIAAEEAGLDSLWVSDHIGPTPDVPAPLAADPRRPAVRVADPIFADPLVCLGYLAAVTERIALGTAVLILPLRHPRVIAMHVASLRQLSGGRVLLGVGCGWLEPEFRALGVDFAARGRLTDRCLDMLRADPTVAGVPLVVGGESTAAVRRALRSGDSFFPTGTGRFALVRAVREARAGMHVTLGVRADGLDAADAMAVADRVVLPVRHDQGPTGPLAVRVPEDVAVAVSRLRNSG
ncbi:LLM class flavin-dependent oxidoreductase [Actinacidiphila rubida]|uniref:Luciferase-like monooxygenase n=1 Tax=Actinacidiphila rubida TaxID=310780 RepID=A0A1H8EM64_9ACTN|nr:LLM class flavin-dependent oxidoreductase [Actinacidiphila rubida]SEN20470.1 Luciferase-like monooxygenase [Actinacidiphila rubida]